jgi:hypothetical protein
MFFGQTAPICEILRKLTDQNGSGEELQPKRSSYMPILKKALPQLWRRPELDFENLQKWYTMQGREEIK